MSSMKKIISPKKTQPARGWNAADICTNSFFGKPAVAPCRLASSQKWGTSSLILARRHTQTNTHSSNLDV